MRLWSVVCRYFNHLTESCFISDHSNSKPPGNTICIWLPQSYPFSVSYRSKPCREFLHFFRIKQPLMAIQNAMLHSNLSATTMVIKQFFYNCKLIVHRISSIYKDYDEHEKSLFSIIPITHALAVFNVCPTLSERHSSFKN